MASNWKKTTLDDVCTKITDGAHQSPKSVEYGKPMASVKDLEFYGLNLETARHISEENYLDLVKQGCKPELGDVLIAKDGNSALDTVCIFEKDEDVVLLSSVAILRPNPEKINSRFLKYYFLSAQTIEYLKRNFISGAAIPRVVLRDFKKAEILLPPLSEQKAIAHILGSLDDKIELNRQMNQTLEAMAQALFKSWFVDFDPVIDNALAAGKPIPDELSERAEQRKAVQHGDNQAVRALFPDEFEYHEKLGFIPRGWLVDDLEKMFELQRGFDLPKTDRTDGLYPLMAASGQDGTHNEYKVKGPGVVTGRSGKIGVVKFVHTDYWPLNTTLWIKTYKQSNPYHAYFFLQTLDLEKYNSGSAVPSLNRNNVHNLIQVLPPKLILDEFQFLVEKIFVKISINSSSSEITTTIRDTLLPKLLSGELRIPDAAALVEDI
jgi:type I restriction enzyme S subunit